MKKLSRGILASLGGGILLLSPLATTASSQASHISPVHPVRASALSSVDSSGVGFSSSYQNVLGQHQWTGHWGTAPFYVNGRGTMHVGPGKLDGPYTKVIDMDHVRAISFDGNVQAPQDSTGLFAASGTDSYSNPKLKDIYHLANLATSSVTNMTDMFFDDTSLHNLDVSHFDTSRVVDMSEMFGEDSSLHQLDLSHFDTHNVQNLSDMFAYDSSLGDLNINSFDTHQVANMSNMFATDDVHRLNLGPNTHLSSNAQLADTYEQGNQDLNWNDNNLAHPGTWLKP